MKNIVEFGPEIASAEYVFSLLTDSHSEFLYMSYKEAGYNITATVSLQVTEETTTALGNHVFPISMISKLPNVKIIIFDWLWMDKYDEVAQYIPLENIHVSYAPWFPTKETCVACDNDTLFAGYAAFVDFLNERMFLNKPKATLMMHCPKCGMYFSYYRPDDEEMGRLYSNYRGDEYFEQRHRHEAHYTREINDELINPPDGGKKRMEGMSDFIGKHIDLSSVKMLLDYGGDKGQFIPPQFSNAEKYVYEISSPQVVDGVTLIEDKKKLYEYKWDIILCNQVMEHLSDVKGYFKELVSHMNEDTVLYVEVPHENYMINQDCVGIHEHINAFTERAFAKLAEANGVKMIASEIYDEVIHCLFTR